MDAPSQKISQPLLDALFNGQEEINIEYKGDISWSDRVKKLEIAKTIFAMANERNGGVIVVGVKDNGNLEGLSDENYESFVPDDMRRFLDKKTNQPVQCTIEKFDSINIKDASSKKFVFIQVAETREYPCVYSGAMELNNPSIEAFPKNIRLRHGALYIRNKVEVGNKEVETVEEWRELIERTHRKYERETIRRSSIISGTKTNPFEDELSI